MSVASPDINSLPPGLVAYLAGGHDRLTQAFNRTLTSLADRGWLELTPDDSGASTVRIVHAPSRGELSASEELALERVHACSRSMPTVPLSELTNTDGDAYQKWSKRFKRALNAESRAMGLTKRTMHGALFFPFTFLSAALFGALAAAAEPANRSDAASGVGFIGFIVGLIVAAFLTAHRLTEPGKQVAAQARTQARTRLNQASILRTTTALQPTDAGTWSPAAPAAPTDAVPLASGPPPTAAEWLLAKDGKPLPEGKAWSAYSGRWRVVTVGPVADDAPVAGRPRALFTAAYGAAFFTAPAAAYGLLALKGSAGGMALAGAPAGLFVLWALLRWLPAYSRRLNVTRRVVFRGQIVKRWTYDPDPSNEDVPMAYSCCVDNGTSDVAQSFRVKQDVYKRMSVGDTVEVDYSPRWHKLRHIRRLK